MGIYFYYGEESYNIEKAIRQLKSKVNCDFGSLNFRQLRAPSYPELINTLRTPPMMFGNSLIVIDSLHYFFKIDNKEVKFEKSELEDIEDALKCNSNGVDIVFVVKIPRDSNKKISATNQLFKILSKYNATEFKPFLYYEDDKVILWAKNNAKEKGVSFEEEAVSTLAENIGTDLAQLDSEIDKLASFAYPKTIITKEMVDTLSISNQGVFNITNALADNRQDLALLELKKLLYTDVPLKIIPAVQTILTEWITIITKSKVMSNDEVGRLIGKKGGYVFNKLKMLKNTHLNKIVELKKHLIEAEFNIKSGKAISPDEEVIYAFSR